MSEYQYRTVSLGAKGGEIDDYLSELQESKPIESYSAAAKYAIRQQMQIEDND